MWAINIVFDIGEPKIEMLNLLFVLAFKAIYDIF